jgi:hypothetical protein
MTAEAKKAIETAVKKADAAVAANGKKAVAEAKAALGMGMVADALAKAEKPAKAVKAPKEAKVKKLAASAVEIDTAEYVKKNSKQPGTGKRDPKAVWRFLIGAKTVEIATEFFREAKAKAIEAAIEANVPKVQVLA